MQPSRESGFTLLEVLLAGFILFITISTMTMVYQGAVIASEKANASLKLSAAISPIRQLITDGFQYGIFAEQKEGHGQYGSVTYYWKAVMVQKGMPSEVIQEDSGMGESLRFFLWQIDLNLVSESMTRNYQFSEISW